MLFLLELTKKYMYFSQALKTLLDWHVRINFLQTNL